MVDGTSVNADDTGNRVTGGLLGDDGILGNSPDDEDIERQRLANDAEQRSGGNDVAGGIDHDPSSHGMAGGRDTLSVIGDTGMPGQPG